MLNYRTEAAILEERQRQAHKRDRGARSDLELGVRRRRLTVALAATLTLVFVFATGPAETSTGHFTDQPEVVVVNGTEGPAQGTWAASHARVREALPLLRARLTPPSGSVVFRPRRPRHKSRRLAGHVVQGAGTSEGGDCSA